MPPTPYEPRKGSVPDRGILSLRMHGKTGHSKLAERIDAERGTLLSLLGRAIDAGLIIRTFEHGEHTYDVPGNAADASRDDVELPHDPTALLTGAMRDVTAAGARFPAATTNEALDEIAVANVSTTGVAGSEPIASSSVVDAARADTPEPSDEALEAAAGASEPELDDANIIEIDSTQGLSCAIYSDGRFVVVAKDLTIIFAKVPAELIREYIRKHWPHDIYSGNQATVRGM